MRIYKLLSIALAVSGSLMLGGSAIAENAGHAEYMSACAVCHGQDGLGNGPLSYYLTVDVPDLTILAEQNDGEFPMLKIIQIIDGRSGVRTHGDTETSGLMPVWGDRFAEKAEEEVGFYGAELVVRGRVLTLAEHLESIQK